MRFHPLYENFARPSCTRIFLLAIGVSSVFTHAWADQPIEQRENVNAIGHDQPQLALSRCNECHASSVAGTPAWQRSGLIWFDQDPHAQAYSKLLNSQSQRIVARLAGIEAATDSPEYRQVLREQCVSCHANEHASDDQIKLGIDCQVCHGPASAWGEEHYSQATLSRGIDRFDGSERINLESIERRAEVCSSCHVGELNRGGGYRPREVDHRLMAAGHPMMYFDFENYLERYPKHWDVAEEDEHLGPFPGYSRWQIGRWVAAKSRLELLRDRAERVQSPSSSGSAPQHDWPEFTESSCTSCHYPLLPESWRQSARSAYAATWDDWYLERIEVALPKMAEERFMNPWSEAVALLRSNMESRRPDSAAVSEQTRALLVLCQRAIEASGASDAGLIRDRLETLLDDESIATSWEQGAQWANSARVLADALGWDRPDAPLDGRPRGRFFDHPATWDPITASSPFQGAEWFRPESLFQYRESLRQRLGPRP